jgi:hypothetical protein
LADFGGESTTAVFFENSAIGATAEPRALVPALPLGAAQVEDREEERMSGLGKRESREALNVCGSVSKERDV